MAALSRLQGLNFKLLKAKLQSETKMKEIRNQTNTTKAAKKGAGVSLGTSRAQLSSEVNKKRPESHLKYGISYRMGEYFVESAQTDLNPYF